MRTIADPLDEALDDLRISGAVLLHEAYAAPWAFSVPDESHLRKLLDVDAATRVLMFHFVRRGSFEIRTRSGGRILVNASEVAICAAGAAHSMSSGRGARPMPIDAVLQGRGPVASDHESADATELLCGVFLARASPANPLFAALPAVLKVATGDDAANPMLTGVVWMLAHEIERGGIKGFSASRLLELFWGEAIRAYQRADGCAHPGWFRGLADPRVGEAIRRVHAAPGEPWTVAGLADAVSLSPSRFAARFRQLTGQSVMAYVARWRLNMACRLLTETRMPLTEIAGQIGYESLPSFSRAFKAHMGRAPAAWRASRRS